MRRDPAIDRPISTATRPLLWAALAVGALAACESTGGEPEEPPEAVGAVYAMTNAIGDNAIVVYHRAADGTLTRGETVPTGGGGSGVQIDPTDSLGSQGALALSDDARFVFAVNTNSADDDTANDCAEGSISVFAVSSSGRLARVEAPTPSGGLFPNAIAVRGDRLFVLNAGGPDICDGAPGFDVHPNVTGFEVAGGILRRIPGAAQRVDAGLDDCAPAGFDDPRFDCGLSPPAFPRSPAQVGFTPDGDALVVSVKGTNAIHVIPVDADGALAPAVTTRAPGPELPTYFGFGFDAAGHLIIAEPFGAAAAIPAGEASAVSSFRIAPDHTLHAISRGVANGMTAACWVAIDPISGRHAYVSNNGSSTLSVYDVAADGTLTHRPDDTVALPEGDVAAHPNDLTVVRGQDDDGAPVSYLYSLNSGSGRVGIFRVEADGALRPLGEVDGLPVDAGAQGLVGF